jgi:hypothetical protein
MSLQSAPSGQDSEGCSGWAKGLAEPEKGVIATVLPAVALSDTVLRASRHSNPAHCMDCCWPALSARGRGTDRLATAQCAEVVQRAAVGLSAVVPGSSTSAGSAAATCRTRICAAERGAVALSALLTDPPRGSCTISAVEAGSAAEVPAAECSTAGDSSYLLVNAIIAGQAQARNEIR